MTRSSSAGWWPTSSPPTRRWRSSARRPTAGSRSPSCRRSTPTWSSSTSRCRRWTGWRRCREMRKTYPQLPVIMFSALTERGAAATLDALALGATDYFTKPTDAGGLDASLQVIREELIPEIKALCGRATPRPAGDRPAADPRRGSAGAGDRDRGGGRSATSTGGPNALAEVFAGLPADFPVPDRDRPAHAADVHAAAGRAAVGRVRDPRSQEGGPAASLQPGHAWIAPGDHHMTVVRDGAAGPAAAAPGAAGELVPAGGGRAVPVGGAGVRRRHPGGGADRHGPGRAARLRGDPRGRRAGARPGRGHVASSGGCRVTSPGPGWPTGCCRSR